MTSTGRPSGTGRRTASEPLSQGATTERWSRRYVVVAAAIFIAGIAIRAVLLPTEGLRGDLDQFVLWVHGIAVKGLPNAYDQQLSFPPVIAYVWWLMSLAQPAFQTVTDASDPAIRAFMKLPGTLADLGLAAMALYVLRDRLVWGIVAAAVILLHPAVIDVSAWWGQYESVYLLFAVAAVAFALNGRNGLSAAVLALAVMTKPQALPFLVPFAAWYWATGGPSGFVRAAAIGLGVVIVVWLPFVPAGGPANYLTGLAQYQNGVLAVLSLRAWNMWWLVQEAAAGGAFISDQGVVLGPITLRHIGYGLTALLEAVVFIAILRDPRPRTLLLGLAASTLIAFSFLTTMHERYVYGAVIFLALLVEERPVRALAVAFGIVFTLNLLAAIPPTPEIGAALPIAGPLGIAGSIAMLACAVICLLITTGRGGVGRPDASSRRID